MAAVRPGNLVHRVFCAPCGRGAHIGEQERDRARRQVGAPPASQPGDKGRRRCIAARRIGGQVRAQNPLQGRHPRGLDRAPVRCAPGGRLAGEQRQGRGGERVHVRRRRRSLPRCDLGCHVACSARPAQVVGRRGGQPEVDEDDPAGRGEDHVGRLDVSVHHGWVVSVEVLQRLGGLPEVPDCDRRVEPGAGLRVEQRLEVRALDPVHRDDVASIHEEVLADQREPRVGRKGEQEPRLGEQMGAGGLVGHGPDLERHLATVEVIECPDHLALAARPGHLERLVPLAEELGLHSQISRSRAGRPA